MTVEKTKSYHCDRRDFMKIAGIGTMAIAGVGMAINAGAASMASVTTDEYESDVLVIGGGMAGCFAAIRAAANGASVTMVVKGGVGRSGLSPWAGAWIDFDKKTDSRADWHDKLKRGGEYLTNLDYVDVLIDYIPLVNADLKEWGAYDYPNILTEVLRDQIKANKNITLVERTTVSELLTDGSRVAGAIGYPFAEEKALVFKAKAVIMATGAGGYKPNGFPLHNTTFDGDAMAYRLGAEITGKEFVDTHGADADTPANCWYPDGMINNMTELEKASLYNGDAISAHQGDVPFVQVRGGMDSGSDARPDMGGSDSRPDMGGSDSRPEMGGSDSRPEMGGSDSRPEMAGGSESSSSGGNSRPVRPNLPAAASIKTPNAATVGGATTGNAGHKAEGIFPADAKCGTSLEGLFACGDALGSMQLGAVYYGPGLSGSGSSVQGYLAGEVAAEYAGKARKVTISDKQVAAFKKEMFAEREREKGYSPDWVTHTFRTIVSPYYVTFVKKEDRLKAALTNIEFLRDHFVPNMLASNTHDLRVAHDVKNMILNCEMKLRAGLFRTESRGTHYREDYPFRDDKNWLCWVTMKNNGGTMELNKRDVPKAWQPDMSESYETRYPDFRFPGEEDLIKAKKV
jgi:succinate dehydrogenase/fumarate reductase flavoprotein subunit